MINLQEEIEKAKIKNWYIEVCRIADELCKEKIDEVDLMVKILNGEIIKQAQEIFSINKKLGKYDEMNIPKEVE